MVLYILQTPNVICKEVIGLKNKDILVSIGMLSIFAVLLFSILYFVFQPVHSDNDGKDSDDTSVVIIKDKEKAEESDDEYADLTAKYVSYETYDAPKNSGFISWLSVHILHLMLVSILILYLKMVLLSRVFWEIKRLM